MECPPSGKEKVIALLSPNAIRILMVTITGILALVLLLAYFISVTRYRLWHSNQFCEKFRTFYDTPTVFLVNYFMTFVAAVSFSDQLYVVWLVMLIIAYEGINSSSGYTIYETQSVRMMYEYTRIVNSLLIIALVFAYCHDSEYYHALIALSILILLKLVGRLLLFSPASEAYGGWNTYIITNFMKHEGTLTPSSEIDPTVMKGYKYIILGEKEMIPSTSSEYETELSLSAGVTTVEDVWNCTRIILNDEESDSRLKDVSLSFALFKLLKRSVEGYPAAEASHEKTHDFVFRGLLTKNEQRVFRVIRMELGFLRDLKSTKYPIVFAHGIPVYTFLLSFLIMGFSFRLLELTYFHFKTPPHTTYLTRRRKNIDRYLTCVLVLLIILMEVCEILVYVFSDWMKVMAICKYVKHRQPRNSNSRLTTLLFNSLLRILPMSGFLRFICRRKLSKSLTNRIGQYNLIKEYNKRGVKRCTGNMIYVLTCKFIGNKIERGVHKGHRIKLPKEVEKAVFNSLKDGNGELSNGLLSLQRNNSIEMLAWACQLPSVVHTIMAWHTATSLCEIRPSLQNNKEGVISSSSYIVATTLSKYCVYLLIHVPELLPIYGIYATQIRAKILEETRNFFKGAKTEDEKYEKMMGVREEGETIIEIGARLGRELMGIESDELRWKILADFWAELIVFLAPSNDFVTANTHYAKLSRGGEFITQLWALLYHAGITSRNSLV